MQISWRNEGDNRAEFFVSDLRGFFESEPVTFSKESEDGKHRTGKIPRAGSDDDAVGLSLLCSRHEVMRRSNFQRV